MGRQTAIGISIAAVLIASACSGRRQLLVVIDTDMALPGAVAADPFLLPAASFDRVRIQMLAERNLALPVRFADYSREIAIDEQTPWPLTFGIGEGDDGQSVATFRVRAYRADGLTYFSSSRTEPFARLTLDRFVKVPLPASGSATVRVVLSADCLGIETDHDTGATCVTRADDIGDATAGVEHLGDEIPKTLAGSSPRAHAIPCSAGQPAADARCVLGGLSIRGDIAFQDVDQGFEISYPRHFVQTKPFYLDRVEMTVRRFRDIVARGGLGDATMPFETSAQNPECTWTAAPGTNEDRPISCLSFGSAMAACAAEGGALPTDAQWEHAARGRGRRSPYVWGESDARCCAARIAEPFGCPVRVGPSAVGTFVDAGACEGRADVSLDGIVDLAGNVREMVRDAADRYDSKDCPLPAIAEDPVCLEGSSAHIARGGSYLSTFDEAKIAARSLASNAPDVGFRCAYRGVSP